jgi:hypothetical protein
MLKSSTSVSILGFEKQGGFLSKNDNLLHLLIFFPSFSMQNFPPASERIGGNSQKYG